MMINHNKVILIVLFIIKMIIIQPFKLSFFDYIFNSFNKHLVDTMCSLTHFCK